MRKTRLLRIDKDKKGLKQKIIRFKKIIKQISSNNLIVGFLCFY